MNTHSIHPEHGTLPDRGDGPEWDTVVVGGGPAGLSAALMLGRARRRVLVLDTGAPRNRVAAHMHGVLGHEGLPPAALQERGRAEVERYGVVVAEGAAVGAEEIEGGLRVTRTDGTVHTARTLIAATGVADDLPDVPGLAPRWGRSVLHCPYCHGWEVRDRRLGVLATSPMAAHQAGLLRQWSAHVVLFGAAVGPLDADTAAALRARDVEIVEGEVVEVVGEGDGISGVRTADGRLTPIDALFTAATLRPLDGFLAPLALARGELPFGLGSTIAVDAVGRTSHARIWAAGNVVSPMANVPMSMGAGASTGAAVNGALVEEDALRAVEARRTV